MKLIGFRNCELFSESYKYGSVQYLFPIPGCLIDPGINFAFGNFQLY